MPLPLLLLSAPLAAPLARAVPKNATVAWGKEPMKMSSTGPQKTLPSFFFMAQGEEGGSIFTGYGYEGGLGVASRMAVTTSCPADVFDNTMQDLRVNQLPWRIQEDWGCERTPTEADVLVIENDALRAAVTPQWGGKVWSLYHKKHKRQLFFNNPAHQPANIGYRKAWSSGGCEWNWGPGKIGHSVFSESPVWTAVMPSELGPVVRVWEYDRLNSTTWQVDILIHDDMMFAHPKVTNPNKVEIPGYWWTCVAMHVDSPKTRILSPAEFSISNRGQCIPWPTGNYMLPNATFRGIDAADCKSTPQYSRDGSCAWQEDTSYLGNLPGGNDFFMHIAKGQDPWITHVHEDGYSILHSHPEWLNGTKFFEWGYTEFGSWNEDFLSATETEVPTCNQDAYDPWCKDMVHEGAYTELQTGPARTQMHTFPVAAQSSVEWTEHFKAWQADPKTMHTADYSVPVKAVGDWLASPEGISDDLKAKADAVLKAMADTPPTAEQIVSKGLPWGGLHEALMAKLAEIEGKEAPASLAPGCPFPAPSMEDDEVRPWLELLQTGTFSNETLSKVVVNFEVSDAWVGLLEKSLQAGPPTHLHYLALGTHALEVGNADGARELLTKSMALKETVHGARNLATFAPTADEASAGYHHAWELWTKLDGTADANVHLLGADLSSEMCGWLVGNERWDEVKAFLATLASDAKTKPYLKKDMQLYAAATLAVRHDGDYATAIPILRNNCFPTFGGQRQILIDLWHEAQHMKAVHEKGGPLTTAELLDLRKHFRCSGDSSTMPLYDKNGTKPGTCVCGPPNLGYRY